MALVQVKQGLLEGEVLDLVTGDGQYYSFKGVPYAAPPVGKLRFKAPQPPVPWQGVRKATEHGPICPQLDIFTQKVIAESEDCLYLNVYTPNLKPDKPLPVMFFIHGGGYTFGSANVNNYGPDFLVNHGVVLVTINYRVETFGFLCLDTVDVPGNAGMKDQVQALKWVNENISQFGGDPKNITVFGESAGGASTFYHILSPMSKGLFQKAISMSGVPTCDWSITFEPQRRAFLLGKQLGFETTNSKELLEFLQSLPIEKLVAVNPTILKFEGAHKNIIKMFHFTPVVEKDFGQERFLTDDPINIANSGKINDVDIFFGYTDNESLLAIDYLEGGLIEHYDRFNEAFVPREIVYQSTPVKVLEIADKIKNYYFNKKPVNISSIKEFINFSSHAGFVYNIHRFLNHLPKKNGKIFQYRFCCVSERNIYGNKGAKHGIIGAAHIDDLMYIFDAKQANLTIDKNGDSYKMIQLSCEVFTNFAKYGDPSTKNFQWKEYSDGASYADIGLTLTAGEKVDAEDVAFWKSVYDYAGLEF